LPNVGDWSSQGGLSGPAIKPIGLRAVSRIHNAMPHLPISGQGGIDSWREAAEYILLGSSTVQLCTAVMFKGFGIIEELNEGLLGFMEDHGFETIDDFVGISAKKLTDHGKLDKNIKKVSSINRDTCVKCNLCVVSCRDGGYQAITAGPDRIPVVNTEECTGCSLCQQVCPVWGCVNLVGV